MVGYRRTRSGSFTLLNIDSYLILWTVFCILLLLLQTHTLSTHKFIINIIVTLSGDIVIVVVLTIN